MKTKIRLIIRFILLTLTTIFTFILLIATIVLPIIVAIIKKEILWLFAYAIWWLPMIILCFFILYTWNDIVEEIEKIKV